MAGAKYRVILEEKNKCIDEVKIRGHYFIHRRNSYNCRSSLLTEGPMDAANILKPLLAEVKIQLYATLKEHRKI